MLHHWHRGRGHTGLRDRPLSLRRRRHHPHADGGLPGPGASGQGKAPPRSPLQGRDLRHPARGAIRARVAPAMAVEVHHLNRPAFDRDFGEQLMRCSAGAAMSGGSSAMLCRTARWSVLATARLSPSVGLSEPWRFVIVTEQVRRTAIRDCFEDTFPTPKPCGRRSPTAPNSMRASSSPGSTKRRARSAVFADRATSQGHGLGRHDHAADAGLFRGDRHPHVMARRPRGGHRARVGVNSRSGSRRRDILEVPRGLEFHRPSLHRLSARRAGCASIAARGLGEAASRAPERVIYR